jgi:hypothetical protein
VPDINVSDRSMRELSIIARAKGLSSPDQAVDYLLDVFQEGAEPANDIVKIYARYKGVRIEAEFSLSTHEVKVTRGPGEGLTGAPSTTAGKVIKRIDPDGNEYRNGWLHFWKTQDGKPIDVYRRR